MALSAYRLAVACLVLIVCMPLARAVLFDYGPASSDTALARADDSYSSPIIISQGFPFFGVTENLLYVSTNGILSFRQGIRSYSPVAFPTSSYPAISPYWGDVDHRYHGNIYYRQASASDLTAIQTAVLEASPVPLDFTPTWGYVVTYAAVPAFPGTGAARNTFQAVLTTNGVDSFVIYNFEQLQWSGAQMGFDAGTSSDFYNHESSRTASILNLVTDTNCGVLGRFVFGVGTEIRNLDPCSSVECLHGLCELGVCFCDIGYSGTYCDSLLCVDIPATYCYNEGTCGATGCECASPYHGEECTLSSSACHGIECGHGTCAGASICTCDTNYTSIASGLTCDVHMCGTVNCMNGGTCVTEGLCMCAVGWIGDDCSQEDRCQGSTCNGHGECIVLDGTVVCRCDDSSFGPDYGELWYQCSEQTCDSGLICLNGGLCNQTGGCDCVYPYTGDSCDAYIEFCSAVSCGFGECIPSNSGCETEFLSELPDEAFGGSSAFPTSPFRFSKLHSSPPNGGGWRTVGGIQFVMVDLGSLSKITRIATQGHASYAEHVSTYAVGYSVSDTLTALDTVSNADGTALIFTGNSENTMVVENELPMPLVARHIALIPLTWVATSGWIGLRWAVYGCALSECAGWSYTGQYDITIAGEECQSWSSLHDDYQSPYDALAFHDDAIEDAGNYCRNPVESHERPWCYTDTDLNWNICSVETCTGFACNCTDEMTRTDPVTELCTTTICPNSTHVCRNGGVCTPDACICPDDYIGESCHIWSPCNIVTCASNGICRDNQHNVGGDYICDCAPGFHGRHCQLQRCMDRLTCYNGGLCTSDGCRCADGWTGETCQTAMCVVDGAPYDCGVGGTCSGTHTPICTCDSGYSQTSPSAPCTLDCGDLQCANGGQCSADATYCQCLPGWYGRDACSTPVIDQCVDISCHALRGSCCDDDYLPSCVCVSPVYEGADCSTEICVEDYPLQHCYNGGTCTATGCDCAYPYEGDECETANYCPDNYCDHGTCQLNQTSGSAVCMCDEGYIVSQDTGKCTTQYQCGDGYALCLNGGTCYEYQSTWLCQCPDGYPGDYCQHMVAPCGCMNGICVPDRTTNTYSCSCDQGWMGDFCTIQPCYADLRCHNGGSCSSDGCVCLPGWTASDCSVALDTNCYSSAGNTECGHGYCDHDGTCVCDAGYTVEHDGSCNVEATRCGSYNCHHGGTCHDGTCTCAPGYDGPDCADFGCLYMDCGKHGRCHLMDDGTHQCICDTPTWSGDECKTETCADGATCLNGGECTNGHSTDQCMCAPGYSGRECADVDLCANVSCGNGVCIEMNAGYTCRCADGFLQDPATGLCTIELCAGCLHVCMNGNPCDGAGSCSCAAEADGDSCQSVDYCANESCLGHGECREAQNGHGKSLHRAQCVCEEGFHGDSCQYQLCIGGTVCFNGGVCTPYGCACSTGWGGPTCEVSYSADCMLLSCHHGVCSMSDEAATCTCDAGWTGEQCNSHQCTDLSLTCENGGTCIDGEGSDGLHPDSVCLCAPGFTGVDCAQSNPCTSSCDIRGQCDDGDCVCDDTRWSGDNCETEQCQSTDIQCQNGGSCTIFGTCICSQGYIGATCDTFDHCYTNPCIHGQCSLLNDGFECSCDAGYSVGMAGVCDTMWCSTHDRFCMNGGHCQSHDTYSLCVCLPGVTGENCEIVDHCFDQDCNNHGRCINDVTGGSHVCRCYDDWLGSECNMQRCGGVTCMNNGECRSGKCGCTVEWTGDACETPVHVGCQGVDCDNGICIVDYPGCSMPVPLLNQHASSVVLTASSELPSYAAAHAYIFSQSEPWMPEPDDSSPWIQAEFSELMTVDFISTQYMEGAVAAFRVSYGSDDSSWDWVRDANTGGQRVFSESRGESVELGGPETGMLYMIDRPIIATLVRIHIHRWTADSGMKFELLGCSNERTGVCACDEDYGIDDEGSCTELGGSKKVGDKTENTNLIPLIAAAIAAGVAVMIGLIAVAISLARRKMNGSRPSSRVADDCTPEDIEASDENDLEALPNSNAPVATAWN